MYNCSWHCCRGYNIVTSAAANDGKVDDEIDNADHNEDVDDDDVRYR